MRLVSVGCYLVCFCLLFCYVAVVLFGLCLIGILFCGF